MEEAGGLIPFALHTSFQFLTAVLNSTYLIQWLAVDGGIMQVTNIIQILWKEDDLHNSHE